MTTVSTGFNEPRAIGADDQDLKVGDDVGEYRIEGQLGKGGFGTVYGAVQPLIGKRVAIKVLARKYSADPAIVSRFVAEARAVNQIRHRNIIDIFSFAQLADGRHYYVMEYLEGEPLDAHIRNHGPMHIEDALPVLRAIARALDAAHAKGIAHRDLKPENIFLAQDADGVRFPKLLDFGIAKLLAPEDDVRHKTGTGVPIGTPYYMSPEQCRGRDVDHRTDIYSFGIVVYRALTGTFPFEGDDYMELLFKQMNEEPPPPSSRNRLLTPHVDAAVAWMMRKERNERPPNVIEGVNALDPTQAITPTPPPRRGSQPSVAPRTVAVAAPSHADALAATYTPQFERPSAPHVESASVPSLTKPQSGPRWLRAAIGVVILGMAGALAYLALRSEPHPTSTTAAPTPIVEKPLAVEPASPPVASPPPASAEAPGSDAPSALIEPFSGSAAEPSKKPTNIRRKAATAAKKPAITTDEPPKKGDIIHVDTDAFRQDRK